MTLGEEPTPIPVTTPGMLEDGDTERHPRQPSCAGQSLAIFNSMAADIRQAVTATGPP
jgi:hypothetical protein